MDKLFATCAVCLTLVQGPGAGLNQRDKFFIYFSVETFLVASTCPEYEGVEDSVGKAGSELEASPVVMEAVREAIKHALRKPFRQDLMIQDVTDEMTAVLQKFTPEAQNVQQFCRKYGPGLEVLGTIRKR